MAISTRSNFFNLPTALQYLIFEFKGDDIPVESLGDSFNALKLQYFVNQTCKAYKYFTNENASLIVKRAWREASGGVNEESTLGRTTLLALKKLASNIPEEKAENIVKTWGEFSLNLARIKEVEQCSIDASLEKMWEKVKDDLIFKKIKLPNDAKEIRIWLQDTKNKRLVQQVAALDLKGLKLKEIPPEIKYFTSLKILNLCDNFIVDLSPIENLESLVYLNLENNQIHELNHLRKLVNLISLNLQKNRIKKIGILVHLTKVSYLKLSNNHIKSISSLKNMTNLKQLLCSYNEIESIDNLDNLTKIEWLNLKKNKIKDISSLGLLWNLDYLNVCENPIEDVNILRLLKKVATVRFSS